MPKRRTILGCIVASVWLVLVTSVCGYLYLQNVNYHSGLDAAKAWARLNDFPSTATNVSVEATGSMFTREFTVTFVAPLEDINSWIDQSPGTKDGTPTIMGSVRKYEIEPGGGAQRAELQVDDRTRTVKIKASWS